MLDRPLADRRLDDLARALDAGTTTAEALAESALAAAADPEREGFRVYLSIDPDRVRAAARAADARRAAGHAAGPLDGVPISVKDLFDVAGQVTRAGSTVLGGHPAAVADAPPIAGLKRAGAVLVGRTNMSEFAFTGVGMNPHWGTPGNPADRTRIPGGSTSGGAVSVADGMAAATVGSDTGGSIRIPAALTGLTGFKPTQALVSRAGTVPLSSSLDSIGPMAPSVACCWTLLRVLSGAAPAPPAPRPADRLTLGIARAVVFDEAEPAVERAFEAALSALSVAGARLIEIDAAEFPAAIDAHGPVTFAASEAFAWHQALLDQAGERYDPRVRARIEPGRDARAADYVRMVAARGRLIAAWDRRLDGLDAVLAPTVPITAPMLAELEASDDAFVRANRLLLRNTTFANLFDCPAVSLPAPVDAGRLPVGLMAMGRRGADADLAAVAAAIEAALRPIG